MIRALFFIALISSVSVSSAHAKNSIGPIFGALKVEVRDERSREVEISGPNLLVSALQECERLDTISNISVLIEVDWGDGSKFTFGNGDESADCDNLVKNQYGAPGRYEIEARITINPDTKTAFSMFDGRSAITFDASDAQETTTLPIASMPYIAHGRYPETLVDVVPGVEVFIDAALVDENGRIFARAQTSRIEEATRIKLEWYQDVPVGLLLANKSEQRLWLRLEAYSTLSRRVLATVVLQEVMISGDTRTEILKLASPIKGRSVALKMDVDHTGCFAYMIDWGDSKKDEKEEKLREGMCDKRQGTVHFNHTYQQPGTYRVRLR